MITLTKLTSLSGLLTSALFAVLVSSASANSLTISCISGYFSNNGSGGGEFTITSNDTELQNIASHYSAKARVNGGFETFCLESNQEFTPGGSYSYVISTAAKNGGGGAVNGQDAVSVGSAWLYTQFATGTLDGYNYTPGTDRMASAGLLQDAIWYLEDEITLANPSSNLFLAQVLAQFKGVAGAKADNTDGTVGAINLGVGSGNQDQIVLIPDGGITLALFGAALLALGAIRRRLS